MIMAAGTMNLIWTAALTVMVLAEKCEPSNILVICRYWEVGVGLDVMECKNHEKRTAKNAGGRAVRPARSRTGGGP